MQCTFPNRKFRITDNARRKKESGSTSNTTD